MCAVVMLDDHQDLLFRCTCVSRCMGWGACSKQAAACLNIYVRPGLVQQLMRAVWQHHICLIYCAWT
jgi:hypothetical protein